jgi:glycosyltransferase involved in cell wall biosynthesis
MADHSIGSKATASMPAKIDLIIPVYNESSNILATLGALAREVVTPTRVLICYDFEGDDTLPAVRNNPDSYRGLDVEFVRNRIRGAHGAVMAGFAASTAPIVVAYPADDDFNAGIIDRMAALMGEGCDIVCASRFMPGGRMEGAPWLKATLTRVAAFTLNRVAALPTRDPTSGFRMFSRRVVDRIDVESDQGFCYSIELLVKVHRLGWRIGEVPAVWFERQHGTSRFRVLKWLPAYLRWVRYAFATTFLRRSAATVPLKPGRT